MIRHAVSNRSELLSQLCCQIGLHEDSDAPVRTVPRQS